MKTVSMKPVVQKPRK